MRYFEDVMQSPVYKILDRINLSSHTNFIAILLGCVLLTCALSDAISLYAFNSSLPEMMAVYEVAIRKQTFITTFMLSATFFCFFLYLLKHTNYLRKELEDKIRRDSLTGLLTREAFLEDFKKQKIEANNDAFLIIDADLFKSINDTHGHLAGDRALVHITNALKKGIRKSDSIGRIGGEEFAVHLRGVNYELAVDIAERLRKNVKAANESFDIEGVDLSVSIGAVIYKEKIDLPTLMTKADRLLYKAKKNGRNRVEHNRINSKAVA